MSASEKVLAFHYEYTYARFIIFKIKMKKIAIPLLGVTSLILLVTVLFSVMDFPFGWIFSLTIAGQTLLIITVYKVLTDPYTTKKTFEDFYEDYPIRKE